MATKSKAKAISEELECSEYSEKATLVNRVRALKSSLERAHRARMRELDQAEQMLVNSDAEKIVADVQSLLDQ